MSVRWSVGVRRRARTGGCRLRWRPCRRSGYSSRHSRKISGGEDRRPRQDRRQVKGYREPAPCGRTWRVCRAIPPVAFRWCPRRVVPDRPWPAEGGASGSRRPCIAAARPAPPIRQFAEHGDQHQGFRPRRRRYRRQLCRSGLDAGARFMPAAGARLGQHVGFADDKVAGIRGNVQLAPGTWMKRSTICACSAVDHEAQRFAHAAPARQIGGDRCKRRWLKTSNRSRQREDGARTAVLELQPEPRSIGPSSPDPAHLRADYGDRFVRSSFGAGPRSRPPRSS